MLSFCICLFQIREYNIITLLNYGTIDRYKILNVIYMQYAPIIIFAFNRLVPLKATVSSVLQNTESAESDLFVFVDGARTNKAGEADNVKAVQEYVKTISGFKNVTFRFSDTNKGLGPSIIAGVTEVIDKYGKAIVIEDDLILSKNCLAFMNQGLEKYEHEQNVFSICAYGNKVKTPHGYDYDSYFCVRSSSWGWATWSDRWNSVDWELSDWDKYKSLKSGFNKWGGSDCFSMLEGWREGKNKSWSIRFCFAQFLQNKLSLFPIVSKINNNGFDGGGTNCKSYNRFKFDFDTSENKNFKFPLQIKMNPLLRIMALSYHSIPIRIWSKIRYMISK